MTQRRWLYLHFDKNQFIKYFLYSVFLFTEHNHFYFVFILVFFFRSKQIDRFFSIYNWMMNNCPFSFWSRKEYWTISFNLLRICTDVFFFAAFMTIPFCCITRICNCQKDCQIVNSNIFVRTNEIRNSRFSFDKIRNLITLLSFSYSVSKF